MKINTKVVFEWNPESKQYEEIYCDSYDYDGEVDQCQYDPYSTFKAGFPSADIWGGSQPSQQFDFQAFGSSSLYDSLYGNKSGTDRGRGEFSVVPPTSYDRQKEAFRTGMGSFSGPFAPSFYNKEGGEFSYAPEYRGAYVPPYKAPDHSDGTVGASASGLESLNKFYGNVGAGGVLSGVENLGGTNIGAGGVESGLEFLTSSGDASAIGAGVGTDTKAAKSSAVKAGKELPGAAAVKAGKELPGAAAKGGFSSIFGSAASIFGSAAAQGGMMAAGALFGGISGYGQAKSQKKGLAAAIGELDPIKTQALGAYKRSLGLAESYRPGGKYSRYMGGKILSQAEESVGQETSRMIASGITSPSMMRQIGHQSRRQAEASLPGMEMQVSQMALPYEQLASGYFGQYRGLGEQLAGLRGAKKAVNPWASAISGAMGGAMGMGSMFSSLA